jgi:hypothetical protein
MDCDESICTMRVAARHELASDARSARRQGAGYCMPSPMHTRDWTHTTTATRTRTQGAGGLARRLCMQQSYGRQRSQGQPQNPPGGRRRGVGGDEGQLRRKRRGKLQLQRTAELLTFFYARTLSSRGCAGKHSLMHIRMRRSSVRAPARRARGPHQS